MNEPQAVVKTIWLVDDDRDDHLVFETALREVLPLASLVVFEKCSELFVQLAISTPDLLFLDINLPEVNGLECLRKFRDTEVFSRVPVIMFTGSSYHVDVRSSYSTGAILYLIKPPTHQKLVRALHKLFSLNWNDPQSIASAHHDDNKFVPFDAE